jgi:hypothetical protein
VYFAQASAEDRRRSLDVPMCVPWRHVVLAVWSAPDFRAWRLLPWSSSRRPCRRNLQRYASAGGQERLFGFHDEAAAMGYLVLAVGGRGPFDLLEPRR